ncbi:MAG: hypothetical protein JO033_23890 [Acidobacteriaceae bacterium]|nr:hypothetical protein [Acidobacteriaceae bacterium]
MKTATLIGYLAAGTWACAQQTNQLQVTTSQYSNARFGSNSHETTLTPRNVNARTFGKVFSLKVDGDVYAQPLYLSALEIPGKGKHNILFIATEHDSVYAFDVDKAGTPLWHVSFLSPQNGISTVAAGDVQCPFINPEVGITSTPVIDETAGTLYLLARTKEEKEPGLYVQKLHALDVRTGKERPGSPVAIKGSVQGGGTQQKKISFDPRAENPRAALLLTRGTVYLTWASSCDVGDYHGWVIAYDAQTLRQRAAFNTSPDADQSGIWQSDTGPAADDSGNIFVVTGNGTFDATNGRDFGDTILKLALDQNKISVRGYFTPHNEAVLNKNDDDLGAGGPIFLPDQKGPHPHLVLIGGKDGNLFVVDRDHMGGYHRESDDVVQTVKLQGKLHAAPAYWNQHVYVFGDDDVIHELAVHDGKLAPAHQGSGRPVNPGATPSVSANGDHDGIVWTVSTRTWEAFQERIAVLHAYDAVDVSHELYNSGQNSDRDRAGISVRFVIATVVNGRVYIGARNEVDVYGLLKTTR